MAASTPLPPEATDSFTGEHARYGKPESVYPYTDRSDELKFYVCAYFADTRYVFLPWRRVDEKWIQRAGDTPRPLYGLDLLDGLPDAGILLLDEERSASCAKRLLKPTNNYAMSWPGGPKAVQDVDWEPLAGRTVNIWPTANEEGWRAASKVAGYLYSLKCKVAVIDTHGAQADWCLADAVQEGWKSAEIVTYAAKHKKPINVVPLPARVPMPVSNDAAAPEASLLPPGDDAAPDFQTASECWQHYGLEMAKGIPWSNLDNVSRVISRHPEVSKSFWYDAFKGDVMLELSGASRPLEENDIKNLCLWLQRAIKLHRMQTSIVRDAIELYARTRSRHPVKEYLDARTWDKNKRLEMLFPVAFGTEDTPYTRALGRILLIGMVARIYDPGCQLDTVVVLEGDQDAGKTTAARILGGEFFAEIAENMATKDFTQALRGKWIIELSELESMARVSAERLKSTISRRSDWYRPSYGRKEIEHPRQCVMIGTTNAHSWLVDETGARRFLPVRCGVEHNMDLKWLREMRDELMGEARERYRAGEDWWRLPREEAKIQQETRYIEDPWEEPLSRWLAGREEASISEALDVLNIEVMKRETAHNRRVGKILRHLGWQPKVSRRGVGTVRIYVRGESPPGLLLAEYPADPP